MINLHSLALIILIVSSVKTINSDYNLEDWEKKIEYTTSFLEKSACKSSIKRGDFVEINLNTFSIPNTSRSRIKAAFIVGEFGVLYINETIIGMCIGDVKRIGIPIGKGKIFYQFEVLTINTGT